MTRPCFLVVDREFSSNISTRKLVIETAKFNVITAYSGSEALETLTRFPNVNAVILDTTIQDIAAEALVDGIKTHDPAMPVILICTMHRQCPRADYHLELFDPASLLELLQRLYPQATASIQQRNRSLIGDDE